MHAAHVRGPAFVARCGPRGRKYRHWGAGGPGFGPGGPRARRGDVRAAILALLAEEPRNGYQLMQEIGERTQGVWKPSPGAVYPALSLLEDEGLVRAEEIDGGRVFTLTDSGRTHVEENAEAIGKPWEKVTDGVPDAELALREHVRTLIEAVIQVGRTGDTDQIEAAKAALADARKAIYKILAGE